MTSCKKAFYFFVLYFGFQITLFAQDTSHFKIIFGSCNKVDLPNPFWEDMGLRNPDLFLWGGDVIYADTNDMSKMEAMYAQQKAPNSRSEAKIRDRIVVIPITFHRYTSKQNLFVLGRSCHQTC